MPRSLKLVIAATALLVISGGSLRAVAPSAAPKLPSASTARKEACKFYYYYSINNGVVICYGAGGTTCAVCPT